MKEIAQIRLENARTLAEQAGGTTQFAARVDREPTQMSRIMGANPTKNIGSRMARHIESCFNKPSGWMDYDHDTRIDTNAHSSNHQAEQWAQDLALLASPRSEKALQHIAEAAREGRLTEDDLLLLERIAKRIAATPPTNKPSPQNKRHERLKKKLENDDSPTDT
ncbi:hypothetical protein [Halomonas halocynthiae]|uniref:hypothetical protein n=1 Tax=Halomonas halocynthiae TaxID=176290 RepID=UPI000406E8BA|nr:hypothetical protein [Halomonas halocynthiae]